MAEEVLGRREGVLFDPERTTVRELRRCLSMSGSSIIVALNDVALKRLRLPEQPPLARLREERLRGRTGGGDSGVVVVEHVGHVGPLMEHEQL